MGWRYSSEAECPWVQPPVQKKKVVVTIDYVLGIHGPRKILEPLQTFAKTPLAGFIHVGQIPIHQLA